MLNFRITRKFIVNGNIRLNGTKVTADDLDAHVGFVPQDDLFIGTLTVYEHLKFMVSHCFIFKFFLFFFGIFIK